MSESITRRGRSFARGFALACLLFVSLLALHQVSAVTASTQTSTSATSRVSVGDDEPDFWIDAPEQVVENGELTNVTLTLHSSSLRRFRDVAFVVDGAVTPQYISFLPDGGIPWSSISVEGTVTVSGTFPRCTAHAMSCPVGTHLLIAIDANTDEIVYNHALSTVTVRHAQLVGTDVLIPFSVPQSALADDHWFFHRVVRELATAGIDPNTLLSLGLEPDTVVKPDVKDTSTQSSSFGSALALASDAFSAITAAISEDVAYLLSSPSDFASDSESEGRKSSARATPGKVEPPTCLLRTRVFLRARSDVLDAFLEVLRDTNAPATRLLATRGFTPAALRTAPVLRCPDGLAHESCDTPQPNVDDEETLRRVIFVSAVVTVAALALAVVVFAVSVPFGWVKSRHASSNRLAATATASTTAATGAGAGTGGGTGAKGSGVDGMPRADSMLIPLSSALYVAEPVTDLAPEQEQNQSTSMTGSNSNSATSVDSNSGSYRPPSLDNGTGTGAGGAAGGSNAGAVVGGVADSPWILSPSMLHRGLQAQQRSNAAAALSPAQAAAHAQAQAALAQPQQQSGAGVGASGVVAGSMPMQGSSMSASSAQGVSVVSYAGGGAALAHHTHVIVAAAASKDAVL